MEAFVPPPLPRAQWQRQPSLLTHMQAPTLPSRRSRTPATLHASPPHPSRSALPTPRLCSSCTSQLPYTTKYCHRRLTLSLPEMPFSHRSGPHALAHTHACKHTHAQMQLLALKAIAIQAGTPPPCCSSSSLSSLCKEGESKELIAA